MRSLGGDGASFFKRFSLDVPIVGEEVTTATSILDSSTVEVSIPISSTETTGNEGQ